MSEDLKAFLAMSTYATGACLVLGIVGAKGWLVTFPGLCAGLVAAGLWPASIVIYAGTLLAGFL
ncbi:hypothetical protein [Rhizobium phage RHph_X2_26]|nr:hypothetical protein [Rhizobium phage RHph_X2_26]